MARIFWTLKRISNNPYDHLKNLAMSQYGEFYFASLNGGPGCPDAINMLIDRNGTTKTAGYFDKYGLHLDELLDPHPTDLEYMRNHIIPK